MSVCVFADGSLGVDRNCLATAAALAEVTNGGMLDSRIQNVASKRTKYRVVRLGCAGSEDDLGRVFCTEQFCDLLSRSLDGHARFLREAMQRTGIGIVFAEEGKHRV